MVICPVCGELMEIFTHAHANKHGFSSKEEMCGGKTTLDMRAKYKTLSTVEYQKWVKDKPVLTLKSFLW